MKQTLRFMLGFFLIMAWLACRQPAHTQTPVPTPTEKVATAESADVGCLDPNVPIPQTIRVEHLQSRVIDIPKPAYPPEAKDAKISGVVTAHVVVDETGKVIWARIRTGDPLLLAAVKTVVCQARLKPAKVRGQFVKTHGLLTYKFELP
jgi:TonB family protein